MKAQLTAMLLICLLLLNCRSKQKAVQIEKEKLHEAIKTDTNIVVSAEKKLIELNETSKVEQQSTKENSGDIIIKGKTEKEKDFHFHNIIDGDTLSEISISGNADFVIKNKWNKTEKATKEEKKEEYQNIVQEIARKSVAQSTIKEVAKEVKKVEKTIESKGFVFPIYLIGGIAILLFILLIYLGRKFKVLEFLNRKR